jgi:hypothetical protein
MPMRKKTRPQQQVLTSKKGPGDKLRAFILLLALLFLAVAGFFLPYGIMAYQGKPFAEYLAAILPLLVFTIAAITILLFPADWWQKSPATQPDRLVGKLFGRFVKSSFRNLAYRGLGLGIYVLVLSIFGVVIVFFILAWGAISLLFYRFIIQPFIQRSAGRLPVPGILLIFLLMVFASAGVIAPFRALLVAVFFFVAPHLDPFGTFRGAIEFFAGADALLETDRYLAAAGVMAAMVWVLIDAFWRLRQAQQVDNLPTSRAAHAAVGLVELAGVARPIAPDQTEIMRLKWDMHTYFQPEQSLSPFYLEDPSGRILVDPRGCRVRAGWVTDIASMFLAREIVLTRHVKRRDEDDSVEKTLKAGDPVYVIGSAEINRSPGPGDQEAARLVVQPAATPSIDRALWQLFFGTARLPRGKSLQNVFFLSDTSEMDARKHILRGFRTVWALGLLWLAASLWLFWSAQYRQDAYTSVELRKPIPGGYMAESIYVHHEDARRIKARTAPEAPPPARTPEVFTPRELGIRMRHPNISVVYEAQKELKTRGPKPWKPFPS